jgi:type IV pilus assembly protein PilA
MVKRLYSRRGGFTLIELMIVVAIIGILAAIAIPNFLRFQLKSKTSEGKVNIAAIRTAEESYNSEFGSYVAAATSPAALPMPPSTKQVFTNTAGVGLGFDQIGWAPEGNVFFRYQVQTGVGQYTIDTDADIDADATTQSWGYVHPAPGATLGIAGTLGSTPCAAAGVDDGMAGNAINQVGPCAATFGQSVF